MKKWIRIFDSIEEKIVITLLVIIFIIIFSHVIGRYVFRQPIFFAEEISRYCFIWMTLLTASIGISRGAHTRVTYFVSLLPIKAEKTVELIQDVCILIFLGTLLYFGTYLTIRTMDIPTAALQWPWGLVYLSAPVGSACMIFKIIRKMINTIRTFNQTSEQN